MAKKQSRKSVSLACGVYVVAAEHAAARAISVSQLIEDALAAYGIPVPRGVHLDKATRSYVRANGKPVAYQPLATRSVPLSQVTGDSFDRGETCAAPERPSRAEIEATRRAYQAANPSPPKPPAGTCCANCIDSAATCRGRVDVEGPEYWLCSDCVLPADRVEDGRGRWKRPDLKAAGGV